MILRDAARMRNILSQMRPKNILSLPLLAKRTVKIFNPKKSKDSPESFDRMCDKHKRRTPEIVLNDLNEYAICIHVRIFFIYRSRQKMDLCICMIFWVVYSDVR